MPIEWKRYHMSCVHVSVGVNDLMDDERGRSTRVVVALTAATTCAIVAVKVCIQCEPGLRRRCIQQYMIAIFLYLPSPIHQRA